MKFVFVFSTGLPLEFHPPSRYSLSDGLWFIFVGTIPLSSAQRKVVFSVSCLKSGTTAFADWLVVSRVVQPRYRHSSPYEFLRHPCPPRHGTPILLSLLIFFICLDCSFLFVLSIPFHHLPLSAFSFETPRLALARRGFPRMFM